MSDDPRSDPFAPPELSTEVCCIHCGETYDSWQIEWRVLADRNGEQRGFWCCPIPGCDGMGFGFDILPTDPHYQDERGGWVFDDESEDSEKHEGSSQSDDDTAWLQSGDFAEGPERDNVPWDDPPPQSPPRSDNDFPFSAN